MHLSGLFIYPVKSLRGIPVRSATVDALGLVGDRRFLVVDERGRFLTQRVLPRMALIETELTETHLILRHSQGVELSVPIQTSGVPAIRSVTVWSSEGLIAEDCGNDPCKWLSSFLGVSCHLVRIGKQFRRPVSNVGAYEGDVFTFADGYPFLAVGEASLADLNKRITRHGEEAVPMNRFRPNLVIGGSSSFAEDNWPRIRIGSVIFRSGSQCERCVITTTDQLTATRGKEPLRTLASYRRSMTDPTAVVFGQNLIHETKSGGLQLGDNVELI